MFNFRAHRSLLLHVGALIDERSRIMTIKTVNVQFPVAAEPFNCALF